MKPYLEDRVGHIEEQGKAKCQTVEAHLPGVSVHLEEHLGTNIVSKSQNPETYLCEECREEEEKEVQGQRHDNARPVLRSSLIGNLTRSLNVQSCEDMT